MIEEWLMSTEDKKPRYISDEISQKKLSIELAYHEASHFVIERLINKLDIGFTEPSSMFINSKEKKGCVCGFGSNAELTTNYWTNSNREKFVKFYLEDKKRLWGECLCLIAGYASYKVFIEDNDYFIGFEPNDNETKRYKLETVVHGFEYTHANKHLTGINDFAKIKERLSMIEIYSNFQRFEVYHKLLEDVTKIMKKPTVENAIRYVKNRLLDADGKGDIKDRKFERIRDFADKLMKRASIQDLLNEYDSYSPSE